MPSSPVPADPRSRRLTLCLLLLLLGYVVFLGWNFAPVAAGADSSGYFNLGRLLQEGRLTTPLRTIPEFFPSDAWPYTPHGFVPARTGHVLIPSYPVGLPLHYAAACAVLGWWAGPLVVGVAAALGAIVGTYALGRSLGLERGWAVAAAACLGLSPLFLYISFVPMSDTLATAWIVAAYMAGVKARQDWRWSLGCGFAFSLAVMVRPNCLLFALPLGVLLWGWRSWLGASLGALPAAVALAWIQARMYGSALTTGYGEIGEAFSRAHVVGSLKNYAHSFPWVLPASPLALAFGFHLPWRSRGRELAALALGIAMLLGFFTFYSMTPLVWWYLRFVLPAFPLLLVLGTLGFSRFVQKRGGAYGSGRYTLGAALVVLVSLATCVYWGRKQVILLMKPFQLPYAAVGEYARTRIPPEALIVCMQTSGALYFYSTQPIMRYDLIGPEDAAALRAAVETSRRPVYATVFPFEKAAFLERFPWDWKTVGHARDIEVLQLQYDGASLR